MLRCNWVPYTLNSSFQKLLVKVGSQSETMEWGMPWRLKIWSMKIWATMDVVNGCWRAQKWAYLERQSMTTMMIELFPDLGKTTLKYIEISHQIAGGIRSGWNVPGALISSPFLCWQTSHSATKVWTSWFIPSRKKRMFDPVISFGQPWMPNCGCSMKLRKHCGFKLWLFT